MRREYGIDLDAVLGQHTMRPSALLDLIDGLSPTASLWRSIDPDVGWGLIEHLMALLIDEVRALRWEFERVNFKGKTRPPDPLPRPGVSKPEEKTTYGGGTSVLPIDEMAAWLGWAQTAEFTDTGRALPPRDARGRFTKN